MSNSSSNLYYFYGVTLTKDRMNGYISSDELIRGMNDSWIPEYQRERIMKTRKINSLVEIFRSGAPIDPITLNLLGSSNVTGNEAVLEGDFHVIDGQQRLWALRDSGVKSYRMPVLLYLNAPMDREVSLFHQLNGAGTKLQFGDFAKSYSGPMSDYIRRVLESKSYPVKLAVNLPKNGFPLASFCQILYWVHRKIVRHTHIKSSASGRRSLEYFLQDKSYTKRELDHVELAMRNVLQSYVDFFGTYDYRSNAYKRTFMLSICHVWIDNFLGEDCRMGFHKFKTKTSQLPTLLKSSLVRELIESGAGHDTMFRLYNLIVDHYNHKLKGDRLPLLHELHGDKDDEDDTAPGNSLDEETSSHASL